MDQKWRVAFFGKKYAYAVKDKEIAREIGWHPKYLSAVLNGHREPRGAEEKLIAALERVIERRKQGEKEQEAAQ